jgi:hypothetical protein
LEHHPQQGGGAASGWQSGMARLEAGLRQQQQVRVRENAAFFGYGAHAQVQLHWGTEKRQVWKNVNTHKNFKKNFQFFLKFL